MISIYDFLWFQIVGMIFLWFWVRLEKSLMFFYGFEYVFVWGLDMICFMFFFLMIFLMVFHGFMVFEANSYQNRKKIVKKS